MESMVKLSGAGRAKRVCQGSNLYGASIKSCTSQSSMTVLVATVVDATHVVMCTYDMFLSEQSLTNLALAS